MVDIAYLGPNTYTKDELIDRLTSEVPPVLAIDTETISLKDRTIIGVGFALNEREAVYFPILPEPSAYLALAWRLLDTHSVKGFHNALYDLHALEDYAIDHPEEINRWKSTEHIGPTRVVPDLLADTATMSHVQGLPSGSLADMSHYYLGEHIDEIKDILPARQNMLDLPVEVVAKKCLHDCLATIRLYHKMQGPGWLENEGHTWSYEPNLFDYCRPLEPTSYYVSPQMKDCYQVDIRLIPLLMRMSRRGIALRPEVVNSWYERVSQEGLFYEDICTQEGFNPASPQQVGYVLAARGNFLPFTRSRRQLKTDDETLQGLSDPLAVVVRKHRELSKLRGTYLEPWLGAERAFTHFRLDISTGRLSSYDRNLQNIPTGRIREVFAPDSGVWSCFDNNQIEMRKFAYITKDPVMLKAYAERSDVHTITQLALWPGSDPKDKALRKRAKTFNFAMIFYATARTLAKHTGLPTEVCAQYREVWLATYKMAARWMQAQEAGPFDYAETVYGRRCRLPRLGEAPFEHIVKCKINYPVQGSAADIVKRQMLKCDEWGMDIALQVHDEVLVDGEVEFPKSLEYIHPEVHTPIESYVGPNWL